MTLLVERQEGHPACKTEWWGAGVVIFLERGADLHMGADLHTTQKRAVEECVSLTYLLIMLCVGISECARHT